LRFIALAWLVLAPALYAHEIISTTQHVNLVRQKQSGWQQDLVAKFDLSEKYSVGAQATYLERFEFFDERLGGFFVFRPNEKWVLEARYLQGKGNEILPEKQTTLSAYHALGNGYVPFLFYRDSRYSVTKTHTVTAGAEIEKIPHFIFIPSAMIGQANFESPHETKDIYSYGLRMIFYREKNYGLTLFGFKGKEASQGIIGRSSQLVDTLSGGGGFNYYFTDDFRGDLIVDHTDYDQINRQFITTTLNLSLVF
jgi:hypothetical protein